MDKPEAFSEESNQSDPSKLPQEPENREKNSDQSAPGTPRESVALQEEKSEKSETETKREVTRMVSAPAILVEECTPSETSDERACADILLGSLERSRSPFSELSEERSIASDAATGDPSYSTSDELCGGSDVAIGDRSVESRSASDEIDLPFEGTSSSVRVPEETLGAVGGSIPEDELYAIGGQVAQSAHDESLRLREERRPNPRDLALDLETWHFTPERRRDCLLGCYERLCSFYVRSQKALFEKCQGGSFEGYQDVSPGEQIKRFLLVEADFLSAKEVNPRTKPPCYDEDDSARIPLPGVMQVEDISRWASAIQLGHEILGIRGPKSELCETFDNLLEDTLHTLQQRIECTGDPYVPQTMEMEIATRTDFNANEDSSRDASAILSDLPVFSSEDDKDISLVRSETYGEIPPIPSDLEAESVITSPIKRRRISVKKPTERSSASDSLEEGSDSMSIPYQKLEDSSDSSFPVDSSKLNPPASKESEKLVDISDPESTYLTEDPSSCEVSADLVFQRSESPKSGENVEKSSEKFEIHHHSSSDEEMESK